MALEEKNPTRNRITALVLSFSGYYYGYTMPIFNTMAVPVLKGHFGLESDEADRIQSNLNFLYCIAATLGVLSMSYLNDQFGRLKTTMGADAGALALNVLLFLDSIYAVQIYRLGGGFITGIYNAGSGLILVEMMTKSNSEFGNLMISAFTGLFGLVSFSQQVLFSSETMQANWRLLMMWPTIFSAFRLLYLSNVLTVDTPVFVYQKYCHSEELKPRLEEAFGQIYAKPYVEQKVDSFIADNQASGRSIAASTSWERYKQLFSQTYLSKTLGCLLLRFLESFTGYPVLVFISTSFFTRIGLDGQLITCVFGVFSVTGSLSGIYFVGKFKRVPTMLGGVLVQGSMFFVIWVAVLFESQAMVFTGLALYLLGYWGGIGGIARLYVAEIIPAAGVGLTNGLSWFTWSFIAKWCVSFTKAVGETNTLFFFALVCVGIYFILKAALSELEAQRTKLYLAPLIELTEDKARNKKLASDMV